MYRAEDEVGRALSNVASLLDPRQRDVFFKIVAFVGKIASGIYRSCHRVHLANKRNGIDPSLDRDGTRLSSPAKATLGDGHPSSRISRIARISTSYTSRGLVKIPLVSPNMIEKLVR